MTSAKRAILLLAALLYLAGMVMEYLPAVGMQAPTRAVIVHETRIDKPLSMAMVEVLAKAPGIGISVWDKDVLGKGKQPSPEAQPFLDAAKGKPLPQLVRRWPGGGITSVECPATFAQLKEVVGR